MYQRIIPSPEYEAPPRNHCFVRPKKPHIWDHIFGVFNLVAPRRCFVAWEHGFQIRPGYCLLGTWDDMSERVLNNSTCAHMKLQETDTSIVTCSSFTLKDFKPTPCSDVTHPGGARFEPLCGGQAGKTVPEDLLDQVSLPQTEFTRNYLTSPPIKYELSIAPRSLVVGKLSLDVHVLRPAKLEIIGAS